ncbi:hypothetical protein AB0478_13745 [Streptomyces sp. NPDC051917]|uniref:hypothetical protein n=1 Tax=Streptomyces sp. NPDC051917 TaxID=3154754 RepID=UPI00344FC018
MRVLRTVTGLSAWHSARLCAAVPVPVVENTWFEAAEGAAARLRAAGAEADVVCGSCTRTIPLDGRPVDPRPVRGSRLARLRLRREPFLRELPVGAVRTRAL